MLQVREIVVRVLRHDRFEMSDDLTARDVDGWDSLTHMSIISAVEDHFHIRFRLKELNKLNKMGDLLDLLVQKTTESRV